MLRTIRGTYGSHLTPCTIFVYGCWYAVEGSSNVNEAPDDSYLVPGVDIETIPDVDTCTWPDGIDSLVDLQDAVDYE